MKSHSENSTSKNISIALATFNGEKYLENQLRSLAEQIQLPCELIVTDDGSNDNTCRIVDAFAKHAPFPLKLIRNEKKLGYGHNFMKAASLCSGSHIAFCDQDDVWVPQKLLRVLGVIESELCDFVAHSAKVVDGQLGSLGVNFPDIRHDKRLSIKDKENGMFFPGFTLTVSKELVFRAIIAVEKYFLQNSDEFAHDELICELAMDYSACYIISEPLALYRQHGSNLIGFHGAVKKCILPKIINA